MGRLSVNPTKLSMMKFLKKILVLLTVLLIGCDAGKAKLNKSILNDKPVFTVNFHGTGTRYQFYVNGVLVENNPDALQVSTEIPVNYWMRSGENTLELIIYPDDEGEDIRASSKINASLQVRNYGEKKDHALGGISFVGATYKNDLTALSYQRDLKDFSIKDGGGIGISDITVENDIYFEGTRKYSITIDVPSNLPLSSFFYSDTLPNSDVLNDDDFYAISAELYSILRDLHNHLEQGKIDDIMPLFSERNHETDLAFYKNEGQTERELHSDFTNDIPTLDMLSLDDKSTLYTSELNLKLASNYRNDRDNAISGNLRVVQVI